LEIAWGHRVRGEPTGFDDIDSDDETDLSLVAEQQRQQARELEQRRKAKYDQRESRFILVKEGENFLGDYGGQPDLTYAYGVLGPDTGV
jgi:hypothetical protein